MSAGSLKLMPDQHKLETIYSKLSSRVQNFNVVELCETLTDILNAHAQKPVDEIRQLFGFTDNPMRRIVCTLIVNIENGNRALQYDLIRTSPELHESLIALLYNITPVGLAPIVCLCDDHETTSRTISPRELLDYLTIVIEDELIDSEEAKIQLIQVIIKILHQNNTKWFQAALDTLPRLLDGLIALLVYPEEIDNDIDFIEFGKDERCQVRNNAGQLIRVLSDRFPNSLSTQLCIRLQTFGLQPTETTWRSTESLIYALGCLAEGVRLPFEPLNTIMEAAIEIMIERLTDTSFPLITCAIIFTLAKLCRFYTSYHCLVSHFHDIIHQVLEYTSHDDAKIKSISLRMTRTLTKRMIRSRYEVHYPARLEQIIQVLIDHCDHLQDFTLYDTRSVMGIMDLLFSTWGVVHQYHVKLIELSTKILLVFEQNPKYDVHWESFFQSLSIMTVALKEDFLQYIPRFYNFCVNRCEEIATKELVDQTNIFGACEEFISDSLENLQTQECDAILMSESKCQQLKNIITKIFESKIMTDAKLLSLRIIGDFSKRKLLHRIAPNYPRFVHDELLPAVFEYIKQDTMEYLNEKNLHYAICTLGIIIMFEICGKDDAEAWFEKEYLDASINGMGEHITTITRQSNNTPMGGPFRMLYLNATIVLSRLTILYPNTLAPLFVKSLFGDAFLATFPFCGVDQEELIDTIEALCTILEWYLKDDNMTLYQNYDFVVHEMVPRTIMMYGRDKIEDTQLYKRALNLARVFVTINVDEEG